MTLKYLLEIYDIFQVITLNSVWSDYRNRKVRHKYQVYNKDKNGKLDGTIRCKKDSEMTGDQIRARNMFHDRYYKKYQVIHGADNNKQNLGF